MRVRIRLAGVLFVACAFAAAASAQAPPQEESPAQKIEKLFERWDRSSSPGCAVGVARNGLVVFSQGYGMASLEYGVRIRPDTIFESGSVAKQFTAAAIQLLAQDGKLSIDDPVRKYVPELPDFGTPILIRHLLNHTSGLRSQWPLLTLAGRPPGMAVHTVNEILELVSRQKELNFKPGDEYLYNNTAFTLLGVIVQRVSGKPLAEFTRDRIFKPLGMTSTQWRDDFTKIVEGRATAYRQQPDGSFRTYMPFTNVVGNGGLLTTVGDLLIWNENLDLPRVGGRALADQLQTRGRLNDGFEIEYAQGLFVGQYRGVREVSNGGSTAGYQTFLGRLPAQRLSVAVLCNVTTGQPERLAHQIADIYLADALQPVPTVTAADVPAEKLMKLEGVYRDRATDAVVRLAYDEKQKVLRATVQVLVPTSGSEFVSADWSSTLKVEGQPGINARLVERPVNAKPRTWELERPYEPTPTQLAEFADDYVSDELSVTYTFYVDAGKLKLRFIPAQRQELQPAFADGFTVEGNTFRFTRDAAGKVDGLRVSTGRVRHLRFNRR